MKKILIILSGIYMIFCFLYTNIDIRETYFQAETSNDYLGESLSFMVYDVEGQVAQKQDAEAIIDLAEKYHVTVANNNGTDEQTLRQFLCIGNPVLYERYKTDESFNRSSTALLSTEGETSNAGRILKYDDTLSIQKRSFMNEEYTRINGWYFVNGKNGEAFIEAFKKHFPNKVELIQTGQEHETPEQETPIQYLGGMNQEKLIRFGIVFFCSAVVILLMYFSSKTKEISIKRLQGYSYLRIMKDDLLPLSVCMLGIDIVLTITMSFLLLPKINASHLPLFQSLAGLLAIKYLVLFLVYGLVLLYIKGISISSLLKEKRISNLIVYVNMAMRIFFVFLLSVSIFEMLPNLTSSLQTALGYHHFIETCDHYAHNVSVNGFLNGWQNEKINNYVTELQKKNENLIGIYTGNYDSSFNPVVKWVDVNHNYIKKFSILDKTGKPLVDLDVTKTYLLIPEAILSDQHAYTALRDQLGISFKFEEIVIKNKQKIFTFQLNYHENGLGYIQQAPILVSSTQSWNDLYFVYDKDDDFQEMKQPFQKIGINTTYNYEFTTKEASDIFQSQMAQISYEGCVVLLYVTLLVLLIVQYLLQVFEVRKKEYLIKKICGYSFFNRYIDILLFLLVAYLIDFVAMYLLHSDIHVFLILIVVLLLDTVTTCLLIHQLEKKSISLVLKGE